MAPLLTIPTAISHIVWRRTGPALLGIVILYSVLMGFIVIVARSFVPRLMQILANPERALAPQLFTLAVVSYCLGMSLLSEWLELSHEAGALFAGLVLMDT
jgi:Kef-type K+ transport system membrane component KefB